MNPWLNLQVPTNTQDPPKHGDQQHDDPEDYPELAFEPEWGSLVRRARMDRGMTQTELARKVGLEQAQISNIENGKVGSSKAVVPLVQLLHIPYPRQYFEDELDQRWVVAGRVLRRVNEAGLRGLLAAAEAMIANSEPPEH